MNFHKYIFCFFLFFLSSSRLFSQNLQISELEADKGTIQDVLISDSNRFVLVTTEFQGAKEYVFLKCYTQLELSAKQRLSNEYDGKSIVYKSFAFINDTLSAFFCLYSAETFDYYVQRYDSLCLAIKEPEFIVSMPRGSNKSWESGNVLVSPDGSTFLVYGISTEQTSGTRSFRYFHFSSANTLIREGEIEGVKKANDVSFEDIWLSTNGKIVISEYVFFEKLPNERRTNRRMDFVQLHVISKNVSNRIKLVPSADEYLTKIKCVIGDHSISGLGVYCTEKDHFSGLFSFSFSDTVSNDVVVNILPRTQSIELSDFDLRFSNGKQKSVQSKKYVCKDMKLLKTVYHNDTIVYVWERVATIVHKNTESYLSTDLLLVNVYKDSILSCVVIPKSTESSFGDAQHIMSYVGQPSENSLVFYFNDYADLYNSTGSYLADSPKLNRKRIILPEFGVVEVKYNLVEKTYERKMLFDRTVFELTAAPVFWKAIDSDKMLLQFSSYRKYRFAYWNY